MNSTSLKAVTLAEPMVTRAIQFDLDPARPVLGANREIPHSKIYINPRLEFRPLEKPLLAIVFIPLLPLLALATTLQESMLQYFNYYTATIAAGSSSWLRVLSSGFGFHGSVARRFALGSVSQASLETVTYINQRIEGTLSEPLLPTPAAHVQTTVRLENVPESDPYEIVYSSLAYGGLRSTRRSFTAAPIRGLANGPPTGATPLLSPHWPLSTLVPAIALPHTVRGCSIIPRRFETLMPCRRPFRP
ncbi:hypothetical protein FRC08_002906 [Ceratobasidium sp. 394]|nr:hypothetical protein FRC08_002906 [Ceratobasidium sp. 394]